MVQKDELGLERKSKVRQIASRQIERHFENMHCQYRSKENQLTKSFNIRTKKQTSKGESHHQPRGLESWISQRQNDLKHLTEQYLREVKFEL